MSQNNDGNIDNASPERIEWSEVRRYKDGCFERFFVIADREGDQLSVSERSTWETNWVPSIQLHGPDHTQVAQTATKFDELRAFLVKKGWHQDEDGDWCRDANRNRSITQIAGSTREAVSLSG